MRIRLFGITISVHKSHYAKKPVVITDTPCKRVLVNTFKRYSRHEIDLINSGLAPRKIAELVGRTAKQIAVKKSHMKRSRALALAKTEQLKEDICK